MHGSAGFHHNSDDEQHSQWAGTAGVKGRTNSATQHILATASLLGLSLVWSTEFAQAGPYLLHLGLSKALTSLVFLAGPLSGLLVQPLIGSYADTCKASLGRRRPFILAGGAAVVLSLLLFGFPAALASLVTPDHSALRKGLTLCLAIASIWTLDASINVVQAMDRALLVDVVPQDQQEQVNAWASRLQSVGSIVGYLIGGADLVTPLGFLANSQIKLITLFSIFAFVVTHALTCWAVSERVLLATPDDLHSTDPSASSSHPPRSAFSTFKDTLSSIHKAFHSLSPGIWHIFKIQFFSWFGLFSILFFSSTWITEIYVLSKGEGEVGPGADPELEDQATRTASQALMAQSVVFLATSVVVPLFVDQQASLASYPDTEPSWPQRHWPDSWPDLPRITLAQAWAAGLAWHTCLMASSWFVTEWFSACVLIALTGVPMGMAFWAPYSLLGEQILEDCQARRHYTDASSLVLEEPQGPATLPLSPIPEEDDGGEGSNLLSRASQDEDEDSAPARSGEPDSPSQPKSPAKKTILRVRHDSMDSEQERAGLEAGPERGDLEENAPRHTTTVEAGTADAAGTILGLHNTAIVLPQLVVSLVASALFGVTSAHHHPTSGKPSLPPSSSAQQDSPSLGLELLFLLGGASTAVAAYYGFKGPSAHRS